MKSYSKLASGLLVVDFFFAIAFEMFSCYSMKTVCKIINIKTQCEECIRSDSEVFQRNSILDYVFLY